MLTAAAVRTNNQTDDIYYTLNICTRTRHLYVYVVEEDSKWLDVDDDDDEIVVLLCGCPFATIMHDAWLSNTKPSS